MPNKKHGASNYYYCIVDGDTEESRFLLLTKKSFYDKNSCLDDQERGPKELPKHYINEMEATFSIPPDMDEYSVRKELDALGFIENNALGDETDSEEGDETDTQGDIGYNLEAMGDTMIMIARSLDEINKSLKELVQAISKDG